MASAACGAAISKLALVNRPSVWALAIAALTAGSSPKSSALMTSCFTSSVVTQAGGRVGNGTKNSCSIPRPAALTRQRAGFDLLHHDEVRSPPNLFKNQNQVS